jgi:O-antigen ligase
VEMLAVVWLAFIIKYPEYEPFGFVKNGAKKSLITFGLMAFFAVLVISCFTGVDFNLSFWGDVERMLGVFHLLHFFVFYLIIITVFRSWKEWRDLFLVSVSAAVLISIHGIGQKFGMVESPMGSDRIISTIGNAAYVGAYAIFNLYFAIFLFFRDERKFLKPFYLISAFLIFLALIFSGTRGAYLGFGASVISALLMLVVLSDNKKIKKISLSAGVVLIILVGLVFFNRSSDFVKSNSFLNRFTQISLQDATTQTRLLSWKAAWLDFPNHVWLGTGFGNYAIIFDKFFNPIFYNYTDSETYFDRAHNNFIDTVSTAGLLGLSAYLFIFGAAIYYLLKGYRNGQIGLVEFLFVINLIIAYFIQNLVVFDSLATYVPLMVLLGYVYWLSKQEDFADNEAVADTPLINKEIFSWFIIFAVVFIITYQFNIKTAMMLSDTIEGQVAIMKGDIYKSYEINKQIDENLDTVLNRDSRNSFVNSVISHPDLLLNISEEKAQEILDFIISIERKNVNYNSEDSLTQMQYAQVLDLTARFNSKNAEKFYFYSNQALEAINKSIATSPGRVPTYYIKAQIQVVRNESDQAIETLKYAVSLNPKFIESTCQLAKFYFSLDKKDEGYSEMSKCLVGNGAGYIKDNNLLEQLVQYYNEKKDWTNLISIFEYLSRTENVNSEILVNLAKLYAMQGDKDKAIEAAKKAAELDQSLASSVDDFINSLQK